MITGLKIHTDNGKVQLADAPDDYSCGDLLADILQAVHPGAPRHDWGLHNGVPEQLLSLNQTLKQNHVASNHDLYLVSTKKVKAQDLELEISAPGGRTLNCEAPSSTVTAAFLTMIVSHFHLGGAAEEWVLHHERTQGALDPGKTLAANGVSTRDQLTVQKVTPPIPQPPSDLILHINAPNGKTRRSEAPSDTSTSKLLRDLVQFFGLSTQNRAQKPIDWVLVDERLDAELDPGKSLAENGIETGAHLLLRPVEQETDRKVSVTAPNGTKRDVEMPLEVSAREFLQDVISSFGLPTVGKGGQPVTWHLFPENSRKELDLTKTLADNRVLAGDRLVVRQLKAGWWTSSLVWIIAAPIILAITAGLVWRMWPVKPVVVEVKAGKPSVSASETVTLTATVQHAKNPSVRWSLDPQIGSITPDGLYSAPSSIPQNQVIHITATSQQDVTKSSSADLKLLTVAISLTPTSMQLGPSESAQFSANLRPDAGTSITWSINPSIGAITPSGEYRAPSYIPAPQSITVTAASQQSPQYSTNATILLSSSPPLHVLPAAAVLQASQTRQFTLRPDPGAPVQWQIRPAVGTISPNGLYAAPPLIAQEQQIVISASSAGAATTPKATVSLKPVAIGAVTASPGANRQTMLHASVTNTSNPAVLWSIEPQLGSISPQGVYTPPAEVDSVKTLTIKATSQADPSKFATFVLHLAPVVGLQFSSYNPVLVGKQRETFSVNVKGTANKAVTWSSVGPGQIMPNGLYIPPAAIPPKGATVTIIATSNADPTRQARVEITLRPAAAYAGPRTGTITWQGKLDKNQVLTIRNNVPDSGTISGSLPGVPVQIHLNTGKCDLLTVPSELNSWTNIVVRTTSSQKTISLTWTVAAGT